MQLIPPGKYWLNLKANLVIISGPFTILAPTDFAFGKVGLALLNTLQNDLSALQKTLEYHVINGFLLVPMIHGNTVKTTLDGQDVSLSAHGGKVFHEP